MGQRRGDGPLANLREQRSPASRIATYNGVKLVFAVLGPELQRSYMVRFIRDSDLCRFLRFSICHEKGACFRGRVSLLTMLVHGSVEAI